MRVAAAVGTTTATAESWTEAGNQAGQADGGWRMKSQRGLGRMRRESVTRPWWNDEGGR